MMEIKGRQYKDPRDMSASEREAFIREFKVSPEYVERVWFGGGERERDKNKDCTQGDKMAGFTV